MMDTEALVWSNVAADSISLKKVFNYIKHCSQQTTSLSNWWLCNTTYELEPRPLSFLPKLLPIGPLLNNYENKSEKELIGQFWEEDLSCMSWLNQQENNSVVYVAFGSFSFTLFDKNQFKELALGLDLTNRPFLWVVRDQDKDEDSKKMMKFPSEFKGYKGKIVKWAPQQKVLSHPSIACFISHCGWNSTLEGLSNGVPFLCWPYFSDQFYDKTYICEELKVGLGFEIDENGLVLSEKIKKKVDQLLSDGDIRLRSIEIKEKVMRNIAQGGRSSENFNRFVEWLKE